ncbi:Iron-sulfur cluster carrier protein [Frankliniella fusca]|uniref:Iron-sulfur cluster carrier protein n=1 Tax=Frankliniella fusca TaxID=407009 RepID=A0AAE1HUY5_9NEOP|nr:Iron-sulfur cluster carrier protein [Frankliniella fusca]
MYKIIAVTLFWPIIGPERSVVPFGPILSRNSHRTVRCNAADYLLVDFVPLQGLVSTPLTINHLEARLAYRVVPKRSVTWIQRGFHVDALIYRGRG